MTTLRDFAAAKLGELEAQALLRRLNVDARRDQIWIERGGRTLLSFSCNDYLNLAHHPQVKAAAIQATEAHGVGAGASRLVTGNHPLVEELEARLARFKGAEAACVFSSGYAANSGAVPCFVKAGDLILIDELAHACLWAGARLSGAQVSAFRHNDMNDLDAICAAARGRYKHALIVTDGVFSMDGDLAPIAALHELGRRHDAWLYVDDAHGLGVVNDGHGAATPEFVDVQMGTLSKAAGSLGGYICADRPVIDLLKTRARTLVYSTGLPPASCAGAIAALKIIETDRELVARPLARARQFTTLLNLAPAESAIVPVVLGDARAALRASEMLADAGFLVTAIRPPTVPDGTARLRFAFTAAHTAAQVGALAHAVAGLARS
jgi:8-amino-7-oxononanoate synthase